MILVMIQNENLPPWFRDTLPAINVNRERLFAAILSWAT